ncbi:probable cytochrome P450 6d5 [Scaptodrosophila lebanonensis]|uniref:Probable cytochrome P450 6d5 n=1 Tax=Drosophila lebanonensis TaxID=7225 RepID=A0A6J2T7V4_DROLE|nr:probable cytochrome P450 6d5 [Scaptodrosophila lebanonensis]
MIWLLLLVSALTLLYVYLKWNFSFWERKGFPSAATNIPFGALDSLRRGKRSFGTAIYDVYRASKEPVLGIYLTLRPALLVRDAQLAHDMLAKDFVNFHDRGVYIDEEKDPMSAGLFFLRGSQWKSLRTKMTPSFTSGKLKAMFGTAEAIADKMVEHLDSIIPEEGSVDVEMKKLMTTYAIDIIGSTMFGLDVDSFAHPDNEFVSISRQINRPIFKDVIRGTAQFLYPNLEKIFVRLFGIQEAPEQMRALVKRTVEHREKHNVVRRDFLQLLLQLRNTGKISSDDNMWSAETTAEGLKSMSVDMIAAQLFLFYVAGYETSASTTAFTLYELMQNADILRKAREDVRDTLQQHNGQLSYDAIQDMKYLELCVMETVRKYPALPILNRECTQDYPIPGTKHVIKKGTPIVISLLGLHRDEEYFPEPFCYQPERYMEENKNYNPVAYMPFGEGPRHCIAARLGKLNVKIALAKILSNFNIEPLEEKREIEFSIHGIPLMPKGGVPVRLSKRKLAD